MKSNNYIFSIFHIIIGIIILLLSMSVVSLLFAGIQASFVNVISLAISLSYLSLKLNLHRIIGKRNVYLFICLVCAIAVFGLLFAQAFVFDEYLSGMSSAISRHDEHTWAYQSMLEIANIFENHLPLSRIEDFHLGKYRNLFTYSSLAFVFGGHYVTNICIWNCFHLALSCIIMVLIAHEMEVYDTRRQAFILFLCCLCPIFHCSFVCHRDIVGEFTLLLGVYLFVATKNNPIASLIAFPFYLFLITSFRIQYFYVVLIMLLWLMFFSNKNQKLVVSKAVFIIVVLSLYLSTQPFDADYGVDDYIYREHQGFLRSIIIGVVGYFPWTQLFIDSNWTYHMFLCLQSAMNIAVLCFLLILRREPIIRFLKDPVLFVGSVLYVSSFIMPGHMAYFSVATPLLIYGISSEELSKVLKTFIIITFLFIIASSIYSMMGVSRLI